MFINYVINVMIKPYTLASIGVNVKHFWKMELANFLIIDKKKIRFLKDFAFSL